MDASDDDNDTVYLLGGEAAISNKVANTLVAKGYEVKRIFGNNRYETAVAIANEISPNPDLVLVATGSEFSNALVAGAAAGAYNWPGSPYKAVVLLTSGSQMTTATRNYLQNWTTTAVMPPFGIGEMGNTALVNAGFDSEPLVGTNNEHAALKVANYFFAGPSSVGIVNGNSWPDALSGGAAMAWLGGPLLLTDGSATSLSTLTDWYLKAEASSLSAAFIFGGPAAIDAALTDKIATAISGPGTTGIPAYFIIDSSEVFSLTTKAATDHLSALGQSRQAATSTKGLLIPGSRLDHLRGLTSGDQPPQRINVLAAS